ncbi:anchored repeat ABC transporter, substrate-binding protein [Catelliglobosispora koreensis]|uniref:anchored repeat ABC transporter, substrate-binding protein n=1 Tax=Catelliglobosispora koreensis TaxID=129052 RepID=UPI00036F3B90|nr:anchored repeat ABC transporter, substrate-binding protein [Catelliglobosispora koreensis]
MIRRALAAMLLVLSGCTALAGPDDGQTRVVTTTEILADLARNVGGERVIVDSLVPAGGDPHSYEPTPADAVKVSKADMTFTNHLLLEEHALIKAIDANAPAGAPNVSLAEASETYGANVIPLVEDVGLDVIWLGLAVRGDGKALGATRASDISLSVSEVDGPGAMIVYLTGALGEPEVYFNSADGLDSRDTVSLPPAAHTHVNWAFTNPGRYDVTLSAAFGDVSLGQAVFTFAVGVDPHTAGKPVVLSKGHTDLAVDVDSRQIYAYSDAVSGRKQDALKASDIVIEVPNKTLETVPSDQKFMFLGPPGTPIHQLPQAVLGKHVHGEIDPHLWQDVTNVKAYVQLIRDTLSKTDPAGRDYYDARTRAYLAELDSLDAFVRQSVDAIPHAHRQLITTHDAFGYLAAAYGLTVAGFVVPNPAQEPSAEQVRRLTETIRNLNVPAVFLEPNLARRAAVLTQVAADQNVKVCKLYGDSFDASARTYVAMMRHNATELRACLGDSGGRGGSAPIVLSEGHVDIGPRFVNGQWRIQLRDDTADPPAWRGLGDVVLYAGDNAQIEIPDDPRFGFLGTPKEKVWLFPQVERPGVLWPGWNTQDPEVATGIKRDMTWRLHKVTGPGAMVLFVNGSFGEPQVVFHSGQTVPQQSAVEANTHVHGNWAFTKEGLYQLDIEMAATGNDGATLTDRQTLTFQIGDAISPSPTQAALAKPAPSERDWTPVIVVTACVLAGLVVWLLKRRLA